MNGDSGVAWAGMLCVWLGLGNNSEGWRKEVEKNGVHWADRGWSPFLKLRGFVWLVRYGCVGCGMTMCGQSC